jgi:hypothetical protein
MRKLLLCLMVIGTCLMITNAPKPAAAVLSVCSDCGGCCVCVRSSPGGPCNWQCC